MTNKEQKTVIISGGLGLLGSQFTKTLYEAGYLVVVLDLPEQVKKAKWDLPYYIKNMYPVDITKEDQVEEAIQDISIGFGIDILINAAAINPSPKLNEGIFNEFETYSLDAWNKTLNVNLTGSFLLSRECIKYMLKNKNEGFKGTIINVTSQLGFVSPNQNIYDNKYIKPADYSVAASGVISLTRYLACYYGGIIKVNCLIPSMVENGQSKEFVKNAEKLIPMGRMSKKTEFNSAIKFLCSDESSYMTGQNLILDGGYTSW